MSVTLKSLNILNFAIIEQLEVNFGTGFSVFSGETGAGKSILFDALGLILGDRATANVVRAGANKCDISACFEITKLQQVQQWLAEHDLLDDDDPELLIRRSISQSGQSKAYINGSPAKLAQLKALGELLIDIHGQHAHQGLLKPKAQRELLDQYGDYQQELQSLAAIYEQLRKTEQELSALNSDGGDVEQKMDLLRYQLAELDELAPQAEEFAGLEQDFKRQSQADALISQAGSAHQQLYAGDNSIYDQCQSLQQQLHNLAEIESGFSEAANLCEQAQIQLKEAAGLCEDLVANLEPDPAALQALSQRLDQWQAQARKHRVSPESLPEHWQTLCAELEKLESGDERRLALQQEQEQLLQDYRAQSQKLNDLRAAAAVQLQQAITENLRPLGLAHAQCIVDVSFEESAAPSRHGQNRVELLVSMNPGQPPAALAKIASGGELARTSLAIQVVCLNQSAVPVLLFDEVDVGIGGGVAETVGRQLKKLAGSYQVFCVTHQAQVAALADQHYRVAKQVVDNETRTQVEALNTPTRVEEIARMIGGVTITDQTRAHAQEMLNLAAA